MIKKHDFYDELKLKGRVGPSWKCGSGLIHEFNRLPIKKVHFSEATGVSFTLIFEPLSQFVLRKYS